MILLTLRKIMGIIAHWDEICHRIIITFYSNNLFDKFSSPVLINRNPQ